MGGARHDGGSSPRGVVGRARLAVRGKVGASVRKGRGRRVRERFCEGKEGVSAKSRRVRRFRQRTEVLLLLRLGRRRLGRAARDVGETGPDGGEHDDELQPRGEGQSRSTFRGLAETATHGSGEADTVEGLVDVGHLGVAELQRQGLSGSSRGTASPERCAPC